MSEVEKPAKKPRAPRTTKTKIEPKIAKPKAIKTKSVDEIELTAMQVADYLKAHPDFFIEHVQLLEHLSIPHPSGGAVSLISKQLELFR